MLKKLLFTCLIALFMVPAIGQSYEEELNFKYVKAKYLVDTERWEDAVKTLNEIIKQNEKHEDALYLRAKAKYMLAAYQGAKNDILSAIGNMGLTGEIASLYAKVLYALDDYSAARNTIDVAILSDSENAKNYELRADLFMLEDKIISACEDWEKGAGLGSGKSGFNLEKYCGKSIKKTRPKEESADKEKVTKIDRLPDDNKPYEEQENEKKNPSDSYEEEKYSEDGLNASESDTAHMDDNEEDFLEEDIVEEKENMIEIDEDLTLIIRDGGLGSRKVLDRPSILILSDEDGDVTVEICVNERGKVVNAEFDPKKSTISKKSLVSLAIRKAKDFWFEKSNKGEQCGYIVFKIKAS